MTMNPTNKCSVALPVPMAPNRTGDDFDRDPESRVQLDKRLFDRPNGLHVSKWAVEVSNAPSDAGPSWPRAMGANLILFRSLTAGNFHSNGNCSRQLSARDKVGNSASCFQITCA